MLLSGRICSFLHKYTTRNHSRKKKNAQIRPPYEGMTDEKFIKPTTLLMVDINNTGESRAKQKTSESWLVSRSNSGTSPFGTVCQKATLMRDCQSVRAGQRGWGVFVCAIVGVEYQNLFFNIFIIKFLNSILL